MYYNVIRFGQYYLIKYNFSQSVTVLKNTSKIILIFKSQDELQMHNDPCHRLKITKINYYDCLIVQNVIFRIRTQPFGNTTQCFNS